LRLAQAGPGKQLLKDRIEGLLGLTDDWGVKLGVVDMAAGPCVGDINVGGTNVSHNGWYGQRWCDHAMIGA
jgi:hypothetical protein